MYSAKRECHLQKIGDKKNLGNYRPRVGISGTTAKSRQRKFVPSSHPGPFALVASSHKYGGLFVPFRYFVLSSFRLAFWRNNAKRKDEITKKRQAK